LALEPWLNLYCDKLYGERHRNGDAGTFVLKKISEQHYIVTVTCPYPDDIMYGVLYGYVRAFRPPGKGFTLRYDESAPRHDQGGKQTVIHIEIDS
jgi:hypothetical protein